MFHIEYYTSLLCFYLKGEIWGEGNMVNFKIPNTIFGVIPLGHRSMSLPVQHIANVSSYFKVRIMKLLIGALILYLGLYYVPYPRMIVFALIGIIASIALILDAFEVGVTVNDTSGTVYQIDFFIFDKKTCDETVRILQQFMFARSVDTNVRQQTDRVVNAIGTLNARL